jgi:uncharacterized coiled-coil protein SlyX
VPRKKNGNGGHKPTLEELLQILISETRQGFEQLRAGLEGVNGRLDNLIETSGRATRQLEARVDDLEARVTKLEAD